MKKLFTTLLLTALFSAVPVYAIDGVAIIDFDQAMLTTQKAKDTFKALSEESAFVSSMEDAKVLEADRKALAEKLQKDGETMSEEEIVDAQRDIQGKTKELEFISGQLRAKQEEAIQKLSREMGPLVQKIISELIAAKEVKLLLSRQNVLFNEPALDLTDDVTSMLDVAAAAGTDKK